MKPIKKPIIQDNLAYVPLSKGLSAIIDIEDVDRICQYNWWCSHLGYAMREVRLNNNKIKIILMHRIILNAKDNEFIDHINSNRIDNRKQNLRIATNSENQHNSKLPVTNTSGYKGVAWSDHAGGWIACISIEGKLSKIGLYATAKEAATAYDIAATTYYGEFAKTNLSLGLLDGNENIVPINLRNNRINKSNTSGFRGVHKEDNRWVATIKCNGKNFRGPRRASKYEAALDYDEMAIKFRGNKAVTNKQLGLIN